ncbi:DUF5994 family protein [Dactylosporangium matsuzakiense]|uniref:Uncharacterized protein n=1 Tax=Dactylosporangium matsuzakiense TaxID=53360 RepID=A0A9W6NNM4_9ACTN|nr:DUF5994 family protein [Dactylosporangium matsuzakiense]UWZ44174.1 hypothetical protein Dmats_43450 [Dactylosporangium matsuzakiense]GLL03388.1 hypothetical protein GCM10017581_051330 [Dactylosporangium matsuzakiense]
MVTNDRHDTFTAFGSSAQPRLALAPGQSARAVLNGGWWPHSWDPAAELPGLVAEVVERYGPIRRLMLNSHTWDPCFDRFVVGTGTVHIRWFSSADPGLLSVITEAGDQLNLLIVPPDTPAAAARAALDKAADPANALHATAILATVLPPAP